MFKSQNVPLKHTVKFKDDYCPTYDGIFKELLQTSKMVESKTDIKELGELFKSTKSNLGKYFSMVNEVRGNL